MLKSKNSIYHAGRKKVIGGNGKLLHSRLMRYSFMPKGSGRRSAYYTDYTFAIKDGEKLVTIAKAYSGLTDKEIMEINKFIRNNSLEKFRTCETVNPNWFSKLLLKELVIAVDINLVLQCVFQEF